MRKFDLYNLLTMLLIIIGVVGMLFVNDVFVFVLMSAFIFHFLTVDTFWDEYWRQFFRAKKEGRKPIPIDEWRGEP